MEKPVSFDDYLHLLEFFLVGGIGFVVAWVVRRTRRKS